MFKYKLTPEDFTEMNIFLMKQKSRRPLSVIKLVLFTVVQMGVITYLILMPNAASTWVRVLLGVFSVIWACQSVFKFGFFKTRAKLILARQKKEDPAGDFWKEHRMAKRGDLVSITYGNQKGEVDCRQITQVKKTEPLQLLMSGNGIVEIVPESVHTRSDWQPFLDSIEETTGHILSEAQEKQRAAVADAAVFKEYINIDEENLIDRLVRMKRVSMRFFAGWTPVTITVFMLPLLAMAFFATAGQWTAAILCLAAFFLLNAGQLMVFTPLYRKVVKNRLNPPGENGYFLAVTRNKVHLFTRDYHYSYALKELKRVFSDKEGDYYFFLKQQMVYVPTQYTDAFKKAVTYQPSLHSLAGGGSEP